MYQMDMYVTFARLVLLRITVLPATGIVGIFLLPKPQVCTDCPATLLPFHVKPIPDPTCETTQALGDQVTLGSAWDKELCPSWCMEMSPVSQTPTESGEVDVRECSVSGVPPQ